MPLTFLAHQVPVLPLKEQAPHRWDGLGLVVGSIMPDLWYVTTGWRGYVGNGQPKWVDAHPLGVQIQYCVLPGFLLAIVLRQVVVPVVPAVLPKAGVLRLHDYRLLVLSRHRWWVTIYSVATGSLTHIALDAIFDPRPLAAAADVAGVAVAGWMLREMARRKLQWTWHGYTTRPPATVVPKVAAIMIRVVLVAGVGVAVAYGAHRFHDGFVVSVMGFTDVMLVVLIVAGLVGRPFVPRVPPAQGSTALPASGHPVVE